jgi:hypothetical protein
MASYRAGVRYIALYDEPREMDAHEMSGYASVHVLAEVFNKDEKQVAEDVIKQRYKQLEWDAKDERRAAEGTFLTHKAVR